MMSKTLMALATDQASAKQNSANDEDDRKYSCWNCGSAELGGLSEVAKPRSGLKVKISARSYGLFCNTFDVGLSFFPSLADFSTIGKALISPK